ncbi:uncharacterized protein G2W53_001150 [Senna tora]|uniref:Uncharacterized protein n=1 Tax=Senna tora TaxID=362788 RepID=A0A835CL88_9FABA|nr:uncharacterized protein G2W53_001150 [Senna tora]
MYREVERDDDETDNNGDNEDDGTKDGNHSEDSEDEETDSDTEDGDDYDSGDDEAYRPGPELFDQDDDDDVPLTTVMKKKQRGASPKMKQAGASSKMKQTASSSKGKGKEKVTAESAEENKDLNDLVWVIAKSSTMAEYNANMERMKRKSQDAWAFLNRNRAPFWSRAGFSHFPKSDALLNNYCEQLNSKLVKMRAKPIITMAEELRLYIVTKMNKERKKAAAYGGPITPEANKRLEESKINSEPPPLRPASMYNETIQAASYVTRSRLSKFMPPQPSNAGHE